MEPIYTYHAQVQRWVDGDTVDLRVDLGFRMWAETRFRLWGIDTPERGQAGWSEAGEAARLLAPVGSFVVAQTYRDGDKYGRWLAKIENQSGDLVNQMLLDGGYAVEYYGGTKG